MRARGTAAEAARRTVLRIVREAECAENFLRRGRDAHRGGIADCRGRGRGLGLDDVAADAFDREPLFAGREQIVVRGIVDRVDSRTAWRIFILLPVCFLFIICV